jgi:ABC-type transporter Mla subunit MlaD
MNDDTIQSILDESNQLLNTIQKHLSSLDMWATKLPQCPDAIRLRDAIRAMRFHARRTQRAIMDLQDTLDFDRG